jgi:hypothetical protein
MNGFDVSDSIASFQVTQSYERRIGEDMIIQKINKIFDEAARDREDFEASYIDLDRPKPKKDIID